MVKSQELDSAVWRLHLMLTSYVVENCLCSHDKADNDSVPL